MIHFTADRQHGHHHLNNNISMHRVSPTPRRPRAGRQAAAEQPASLRLADVVRHAGCVPEDPVSPATSLRRQAAHALVGQRRAARQPPPCSRNLLISLIALNIFALIICASGWAMYRHTVNRAEATAKPEPAQPEVIGNDNVPSNYLPRDTLMLSAVQEEYRWDAKWHPHGLFYRDAQGNLMFYDVERGIGRLNVPDYLMKLTANYSVSADGRYLLLAEQNMLNMQVGHRDLLRYSYFQINPFNKIEKFLGPLEGNTGNVGLLEGAVFGPRGSQVAFVLNHNIYYKSAIDNIEICHQVSHGGSKLLSHGITDYGYDGVIFDEPAMWFSPDGRYLAWLTFDDKGVQERHLFRQHPFIGMRKWSQLYYNVPMVDMYGPLVNVSFVQLADAYIRDVRVVRKPDPVAKMRRTAEAIVTAVHWTADVKLVIVWASRLQNIAYIQICKTTNACENVAPIRRRGGWVPIRHPLHSGLVGNQMMLAVVLPPANRTMDRSKQINFISLKAPFTSHQIHSTSETIDVLRILQWSTVENVIFYVGSEPTMPERQNVYAIFIEPNTTSPAERRPSFCLTCPSDISSPTSTTFYSHFDADFQSNSNWVVLNSQGPSVPRFDVLQWHVVDDIDEHGDPNHSVQLHKVHTLEVFDKLRVALMNVTLPRIRYESLALSNKATGLHARVKLMLPDGLSRCTGSERLPLLVRGYNGPGTYAGASKFEILWDAYYAVNRSVVVAVVDARGSGRMGMEMQYAIFRQLGIAEAADLLDVVEQLTRRFRCIDPNRVGMWGDQSYSSYLVGMTMAADKRNIIKCGHMAQPITDFRRTNALYVEPFMGFYMSEMYRKSSLSEQTSSLKDKSLQLVHASENIFYDVSKDWGKKMFRDEVLLEELEYPVDLPWRQDRIHLYEVMTNYFDYCFKFVPKRKQYRSIQY